MFVPIPLIIFNKDEDAVSEETVVHEFLHYLFYWMLYQDDESLAHKLINVVQDAVLQDVEKRFIKRLKHKKRK